MKISETQKILSILAVTYPVFTADDPKKTEVWHSCLNDLDYTTAKMATQKLILESPYPPTIHDIRKRAMEVQHPELPTAAEAWGVVLKNISRYGSYRVTEGLAALPPIIRDTVECMGYIEICRSEDPEGVLRAQFMRMYEQILNRRKNEQLLPNQLKEQIRQITGNVSYLPTKGA